MSMLPTEVHTALSQLLAGLQSTDNDARARAEEELNSQWVEQRPEILLMGLVEQIQAAQDAAVRKAHPRIDR